MQMMSAGAMGGGISSAIARALGARSRDDADALASHALVIAIVFGLVFTRRPAARRPLALRGDGRQRRLARRGADLLERRLRRRGPGVAVQLAGQRHPRHRQHGGAGHRHCAGAAGPDPAVAVPDLRLGPVPATGHRRWRGRGVLYYALGSARALLAYLLLGPQRRSAAVCRCAASLAAVPRHSARRRWSRR